MLLRTPPLIVFFCFFLGISQYCGRAAGEEAQDRIRDAANLQNNGAFAAAAEEWQEFLNDYPDDLYASKARYFLGVCCFQLEDYPRALKALEKVVADEGDASFPLLEDAYWNLGSAQYAMGLQDSAEGAGYFTRAVETYTGLLTKFPKGKGKYCDQAHFYCGEALYSLDKKQEAVAAYRQLVDEYGDSPLRPDGLYALGVTYEELGDHAAAGLVYSTYLDEFSDLESATEIRMRKAETELQAERFSDAEKMFAEVGRVPEFADADHARMRQAFCLWKLARFPDAAEIYAVIAQRGESEHAGEAVRLAGRAFYRAERFDDAVTWLEKSIAAEDDGTVESAHWLCRIHLQRQEPEKASELAEKVLPSAGDNPYRVHLELDRADAMFQQPDQQASALDLYARIANDFSDHELAADATYFAAYAAMELAEHDQGMEHVVRFIERFPEHALVPDVIYVKAECQLLRNQYAESEQTYRRLTADYADHPDSQLWHLRLATAMFLQNRHDDTVSHVQSILTQLEGESLLAEAHYLMGTSLLNQSKYAEAVSSLQESLAADAKWDKADETLLNLGKAHAETGQTKAAMEVVQRLITEYPDSQVLDRAYYRYGQYRFAVGEYEQASQLYGTILDRWPDSVFVPLALSGIGWSQYRLKDFQAGTASFTNLIQNHADHELVPDARYARALCRKQLMDFSGTVEDLKAYLDTNPEVDRRSHARFLVGLVRVEFKEYKKAVQEFRSLLKDNPEYAGADRVAYQLAWAYKLLENQQEAVGWFKKLTNDYPQSQHAAESYYHVGEHEYWQSRDFPAALEAYRQCKNLDAGPELDEKSTYMIGWTYYQLENYEKADQQFTEQVTNYPDAGHFADALFMKGECLFQTQQFKPALDVYQRVRKLESIDEDRLVLTLLRGGQCAGQLEEWGTSLAWLEQVSDRFPDSARAAEALFEQGVARFALGRAHSDDEKENPQELERAFRLFRQVSRKARTELGARALFHAGEVQFQKKKFIDAIQQYQRVMYGYGGERAPAAIKKWQASAGFQAGQASLVLAGQADQGEERNRLVAEGKKYFKYVVEKHPQSDLVPAAQKKLQ